MIEKGLITLKEAERREAKAAKHDKAAAEGKSKANGHPRAAEINLRITCVCDVEPEPVEWLWPGRLARGKLTLVAGDPGIGKSQIAIDAAARTSAGLDWPDGGRAVAGCVLILSAEDAIKDTIRPRLEAAGADLKRVHVIEAVRERGHKERSFNLKDNIIHLGSAVKQIGDVALLVIDPITSYMGTDINSHQTTDVRAVLEPLARFADQSSITVLGISHPPKGAQGKAINAVTGSLAYVAAARTVFIAIEEPETDRRLLLPVKSNLAAPPPGLGYSLHETITSKGIVASRVVWDSQPVLVTANEALRASNSGSTSSKLQEAEQFLHERLANCPASVDELFEEAKRQGIAEITLRRAGIRLNVVKTKTGFRGGWTWSLPDTSEDDQPR